PVAGVVDDTTAFPAAVRAEDEADRDRDQLTETEQDDRRPHAIGDDLGHVLALVLVRLPQVALEGRRDVPGELIREERLVESPTPQKLATRGSRLVGVVRHPLGRPRHRPEQDEVEHDDPGDGQHRLQDAAQQVARPHDPPALPRCDAGWASHPDHSSSPAALRRLLRPTTATTATMTRMIPPTSSRVLPLPLVLELAGGGLGAGAATTAACAPPSGSTGAPAT